MKSVLSIFFLSLYFGYCFTQQEDQKCPQPKVRKRTIIQSTLSKQNGADFLQKETVASARECYQLCCNTENCNVAVMHYSDEYNQVGEVIMKKYCFLFDCKSPSVCSYKDHSRYAIIEVPKVKTPYNPMTTEEPNHNKITSKMPTQKTSTTKQPPKPLHEKCPPGAPVAMCADNPCQNKVCPAHKDAICKPSFCGGCYAKFYNDKGEQVQCQKIEVKANEETVNVASTDYKETPVDSLPVPAKISHAGPTEDPYYQPERRKWVDGEETGHLINATLPKTTSRTTVTDTSREKVIVVNNSFMSIPLLIALCICILLILGLIYRFKCAPRGKPKKLAIDDGDYLINGMYL